MSVRFDLLALVVLASSKTSFDSTGDDTTVLQTHKNTSTMFQYLTFAVHKLVLTGK